MKKLLGLGRGLESLIPTKPTAKVARVQDSVFYIEVSKIRVNPNQPRRDFDPEALRELSSSIKKYGILQPLLVSKFERETGKGLEVEYELIAGERRLRAAKLVNMPHVPVIIKNNFDESRLKLEVALVENVQREDLGALEEAEAYARLANEFSLTQKDIASKVGKSREVIANSIRLLGLPAEIKEGLISGKISKTHARTLLAFKDPNKQREIFRQILAGSFVVRDVEKTAREYTETPSKSATLNKASSRFHELEQNLSKNLAAVVAIKGSADSGKIVIGFADLQELNRIVKTILD